MASKKTATINGVKAREVLDSRGNPTVEVEVWTAGKAFRARSMVPSGASTGVHEALELRDGGLRYGGKGVKKAVKNVNELIAGKIKGMDCTGLQLVDEKLIKIDGTDNKSKLGANAILGVSMACAKLGAKVSGTELYDHIGGCVGRDKCVPVPCMNIINGGAHAENNLDFQEYMIVPSRARSFSEGLRIGAETYHALKRIIAKKYGKNSANVGDEGGFAPTIGLSSSENKQSEGIDPRKPIELINQAADEAGHSRKIEVGLDCAASEFFHDGKYLICGKKMSGQELGYLYQDIIDDYDVISIEDPFSEDDWESWVDFTKSMGKKVQIVGDDLLVTNTGRISKALQLEACNGLLLKVNQIGTVTEALAAAKMAVDNRWGVMTSHRSGETEDSFIADLSVALGTGQIKSGAPARGERTAKYNQLLRIEEESGLPYAGRNAFKR